MQGTPLQELFMKGGKIAVIDGGNKLSGLYVLRGCMPSKTLIYSAEVLHLAKQGGILALRMLI